MLSTQKTQLKPDDDAPNGGGGEVDKLTWDDIARPATALTLFTTGLAALAVAGPIERVQRDEPEGVLWGIRLVLLAGVIWALLAVLRSARKKTSDRWIAILTCLVPVVLGLGLFAALNALVEAQRESPRPRVEAGVKTQDGIRMLEAKVRIAGVPSDDHVRVVVEGLGWERDSQGQLTEDVTRETGVLLYEAWIGADSAGVVEHTITTPLAVLVRGEIVDELSVRAWVLPSIPAVCREAVQRAVCRNDFARGCADLAEERATGCAIVRVPRSARAPQINATWMDDRIAVIEIKADGIPAEAGAVATRVYGGSTLLGSAAFRPNSQGAVTATMHVPAPTGIDTVCIVAVTEPEIASAQPTVDCPPGDVDRASWLVLPAPPVG